jgi:ectoine hydroxylase-related dioxygenase (phytanoyl-CoA dioxygenase family)
MAQTETSVHTRYERDGFVVTPPLVEAELVAEAIPHMDAVIAAEYETGIAPHWRKWDPGDDEARLRKIDQPQLCDRTIQRLVAHPAIGQTAAELTGASTIQVWGVQLLYKPPGGGAAGNVGWHQDQQYWLRWWTPESEIFTCWLALSDVNERAGAMRFVPGSHRWGLLGEGDFYEAEIDRQRDEIHVPDRGEWREVVAELGPGAASFHHRLTYHGSGPNSSGGARCSFAIHLRTERSEPADLSPLPADQVAYMSYLDDRDICPVIFGG